MSLNGDVTVFRNGRSTSQISVYNYPEHLNPFYDDDQHKRLRFWKIGKNKNNSERRNSFSISNLRDIWSFKPFNLHKKSSTLGINKTSESPPLLRRQFGLHNSDNRQTINTVPTYEYSDTNDNFLRNNHYRTSLQSIGSSKQSDSRGLGFYRNNPYRSTTQYSGTHKYSPQSLRSSQNSLASTNPFDSNNDHIEESGTKIPMHRKKRRAPQPPKSISGDVYLVASEVDSHRSEIDSIREKENVDIMNLTAEIESFVKISSEESTNVEKIQPMEQSSSKLDKVEKITHVTHNFKQKNRMRDEENGSLGVDVTTIMITNQAFLKDPITPPSTSTENKKNDTQKISLENAGTPLSHLNEGQINATPISSLKVLDSPPSTSKEYQLGNKQSPLNDTTNASLKELVSPSNTSKEYQTSDKQNLLSGISLSMPPNCENNCIKENYISETLNHVKNPMIESIKPENHNDQSVNKLPDTIAQVPRFNDAKATNIGSLSKKTYFTLSQPPVHKSECNRECEENCTKTVSKEEITVLFNEPLTIVEPNQRTSQYEGDCRVQLVSLEYPNAQINTNQRKKKRSVKDIIESINRSQRLLNESAAKGTHVYSTSFYNKNNESTNCSSTDKQIQNKIEMKQAGLEQNDLVLQKKESDEQHNDVTKPNNECVFEKAKINKVVCQLRESSPTSNNLDWNPLPKPKRSKNFGDV